VAKFKLAITCQNFAEVRRQLWTQICLYSRIWL